MNRRTLIASLLAVAAVALMAAPATANPDERSDSSLRNELKKIVKKIAKDPRAGKDGRYAQKDLDEFTEAIPELDKFIGDFGSRSMAGEARLHRLRCDFFARNYFAVIAAVADPKVFGEEENGARLYEARSWRRMVYTDKALAAYEAAASGKSKDAKLYAKELEEYRAQVALGESRRLLKVGETFPPFSVPDLDMAKRRQIEERTARGETAGASADTFKSGEMIHFEDYRGKVVLIHVWAAW
jgi:hypothetical protein